MKKKNVFRNEMSTSAPPHDNLRSVDERIEFDLKLTCRSNVFS